ncbi:MAG: LemA family protein [Leptospirillia bacterium]
MPHLLTISLTGIALAVLWFGLQYHRLRRLARLRDQAMDALAAAFRVRQDLTLDLVKLCGGYLVMDDGLLEAVALSRSYAMQARSVLARTKTETDLCWVLARLLVTVEKHPDLASHPSFSAVSDALVNSEIHAAYARTQYNAQVEAIDNAVHHTPAWLAGKVFGIQPGQVFDLDPRVAREAMMSMLTPGPELNRPQIQARPTASVAFGS